jgi:hypothetical protein
MSPKIWVVAAVTVLKYVNKKARYRSPTLQFGMRVHVRKVKEKIHELSQSPINARSLVLVVWTLHRKIPMELRSLYASYILQTVINYTDNNGKPAEESSVTSEHPENAMLFNVMEALCLMAQFCVYVLCLRQWNSQLFSERWMQTQL